MSQNSIKNSSNSCPQDIEEFLPLITNGVINLDEHPDIKKQLATNPSCRKELKELETLYLAIQKEAQEIPVPEEEILDNILNTIQRQEGEEPSPPFVEKIRELFKNLFPSPAFGVALATAMVIIVFQFGVIIHQHVRTQTYRTLSGVTAVPADRIVLNIIFNAQASEETIRNFLERHKGQIVGGPGPAGVYIVSIPRPKDLEALVRTFRSKKDIILFVEVKD